MPSAYPNELKVKTICRCEKDKSIKVLSEELYISNGARNTARSKHLPVLYLAEFDAISRQLQKLEHQMETIRKSGNISGTPLQGKLTKPVPSTGKAHQILTSYRQRKSP